ncbi:MAG: hypothetical protein EA352_12780 [Gemmatimonadales bacterium]|nr:MAG: hypothetical protein EA352_12780 [Gemmatimonadales bacterium]
MTSGAAGEGRREEGALRAGGGEGPVSGAGPIPEWIREWAPSAGEEGTALPGALEALRQALERTGRDRDGARALLAADALLTTVLEEAARSPDPEGHLRAALEAVARGGDPTADLS